ncbi:MAG TPA: beta-ketoacyl-ACP synthase II [Bacillota bacterium]|nr:beta-ketoacyl-ACP synthase II [Bacillota bacterium]HOA15596.1 beta-ketoacyl-ACP synthase II [Bacillota bacterium]
MNRVAITGIGAITPIGNDAETIFKSMQEGRNGISRIEGVDVEGVGTDIAAQVKNFEPGDYFERRDARRMDRFTQFAVAASVTAMRDAGIPDGTYDPTKCGVYVGSGIGGITTLEEEHRKMMEKGPGRVSALFIPMLIGNMAAGNISARLGFRGASMSIVTACASGANSLGEAMRAIRHGYLDMALAGGTEAPLSRTSMAGFWNMTALSSAADPDAASTPFDRRRSGFVMGEGAALLVLERMDRAVARGARIYAELAGYGATDDAYHITSPDPEGRGAAEAMLQAVADAGLFASDIDYVNAHGTSTPLNDKYETAAIKRAFGDHAGKLAVSSTKSMTGHLLGAAGAIEAAITALAVQRDYMPPTINYLEPDPECDLDYVPNKGRACRVDAAISNSLGFGGHNACLLIRKADKAFAAGER